MANPLPHPRLAEAASKLASKHLIINSYKSWHNKETKFAFTENPRITESFGKPSYFPSSSQNFPDYWQKKLKWQKKEVLIYLAGNVGSAFNPSYDKIKLAYDKWPHNVRAMFYGWDYPWACNLFVGEAMHMAGFEMLTNNKYYNAKQIYNGEGRFQAINKRDEKGNLQIQVGDLVCFYDGIHVEIVTAINKHKYASDGFCSRGAGRSDGSDGEEACDSTIWWDKREIGDNATKFIRIER